MKNLILMGMAFITLIAATPTKSQIKSNDYPSYVRGCVDGLVEEAYRYHMIMSVGNFRASAFRFCVHVANKYLKQPKESPKKIPGEQKKSLQDNKS